MYGRILLLLLLWHTRPVRPAYSCLCSYSTDTPVFESSSSSSVLGLLGMYDCKPLYTVTGLDPDFLAVQFNGTIGYIKQDGSTQGQVCAGYPVQTDLVTVPITSTTSTMATVTSTQSITTTTTSTTQNESPSSTATTTKPTSASPTSTTVPITVSSTSSPATTTKPTSASPTPTTVPTTVSSTSSPATTTNPTSASPTPTTIPTTVMPTSTSSTTTKPATVLTASVTLTAAALKSTTVKLTTETMGTMRHTEMTTSVATFASTTPTHDCPAGWSSYGTSCYLFKIQHDEANNWHEAKAYCHAEGGHLLFIESQDEDQYIYSQIHQHHTSDHDVSGGVWIGASDLSREGHWMWRDFKEGIHMYSYQNWARDQPNNDHNQDCAMMRTHINNWNDRDCSDRYGFICERSPPVECDSGWTTVGDTCYLYRHDMVTWTQANMQCVSLGGHLAFIESDDEQDKLHAFIHNHVPHSHNDDESRIWMGARYMSGHGDWVWRDTSSPMNVPIGKFSAWGHGEPGHDHCGAIARTNNYLWTGLSCNHHLRYVCEKTPSPSR